MNKALGSIHRNQGMKSWRNIRHYDIFAYVLCVCVWGGETEKQLRKYKRNLIIEE